MKTETATKILTAFADVFQAAGIDAATFRALEANPEIAKAGMAAGTAIGHKMFPERPQPLTDAKMMLEFLRLLLTDRESLEQAFRRAPEPPPEMLTNLLAGVKAFKKAVLPMFREAMMETAKKLPHSSGGRPRKIPDAEERAKIRSEVTKLVADGYTVGRAKERVAAKNGISLATVRRICREKKRLP